MVCQCLQDVVSCAGSFGHFKQCVLNEKKVSKYTHSNFWLWTRGSSESAILIFRWVLTCARSGVNKFTDDLVADINSELTRKKPGHLRQISVDFVL